MEENKTIWDLSRPSLCKVFEKHFMFGNIWSPHDMDDPDILEMFKHHYNAVTAENAMKPVKVSSGPGEYDFEQPDKMIAWAAENGITVVGHTLIWHGQSAPWLNKTPDGSPLTRAEAKKNMEAFIKTYVSRYSGKIYSWDVINEAFVDNDDPFNGDWRFYLRRETDNPRAVGHWYLAYANGADAAKGESGADYLFDAYYLTRRYDPKAVLYYNDYNEEFPTKREAIARMVEDINEQWRNHTEYDGRLLIEGIGMQCHHNHIHTNLDVVNDAVERYIKTGAKIAVTELDFTFGSQSQPAAPLTPEESQKQAEMFAGLFKIFMKHSAHVERVTMWGKNDAQSWRFWGSPTFFHGDGKAKEAFNTVIAQAQGIDLKADCPCANRDCPRHGDCNACETAHAGREYPPACKRG